MPIAPGVSPAYAGLCGYEAFITKLDGAGRLVYSTYLGGSQEDWANGVAVDVQGNVYVVGETRSFDFHARDPIYAPKVGNPPTGDAFVMRFDPSLRLTFSTHIGGDGSDQARAVAVNQDGSILVAGWTTSPDFPTVRPLRQTLGASSGSGFLLKLVGMGAAGR